MQVSKKISAKTCSKVSKNNFKKKMIVGTAVVSALTFSHLGCLGKTTATPTTPVDVATVAAGPVSLQSRAFQASSASMLDLKTAISVSQPVLAVPITSFSFCVTQLKIESDGGTAIQKDGKDAIEAKIGLVSTGEGSSATNWGQVDIPTGSAVKKIKIEVHKDAELCGVDYSVKLNDTSLAKDVEFTFTFATAKDVTESGVVTLDLGSLLTAFSEALSAGQFNDEQISHYLEQVGEGECTDEEAEVENHK